MKKIPQKFTQKSYNLGVSGHIARNGLGGKDDDKCGIEGIGDLYVEDGIIWCSRLCGLTWSNVIPYKHRSVDWQVSHLSSSKDKMQKLIAILIGSIVFAGSAKRDVISGLPEKKAVKWRLGAGTVIALGSVAFLSVFAYIDPKSLFKWPKAIAEWCFFPLGVH